MLRFSVFITCSSSIIGCILISGVATIPPPPPPPPLCGDGEVLSYCYNNHCVRRYCVEQEVERDCKSDDYCIPGCLCKEGYLRTQNGTCVPHDKCPTPILCGENEIYSRCINNACFKMNCSQLDTINLCTHYLFDGKCVEGCMCSYQYLRADNGTCVPRDECLSPLAQETSAPSSSNSLTKRSTSEDGSFNVLAIPIPPIPLVPFCGENEVISDCYNNNCIKVNCNEKKPASDCKLQDTCRPGCICQDGYFRAQNGTCVPEGKCPEPIVCGENEEYSNCFSGFCFQTSCFELGRPPLCRDLLAGSCVPGCVCKYDHLRNANGTCVPTKECPKEEVCSKPNEYYDPCSPACPNRDCRYYDSEASCPPQPDVGDPSCYPSCRCKEGFYKNGNQDCVPYEDCSKFCYGINEYFVAYPETCEPQTCDNDNSSDQVSQSANATCNSECRCFPDFVRNKYGQCIAKENCGKCQGPNEYFGCKSFCDNVCATLQRNEMDCQTKNDWGLCVDMCYCDEGYSRDANNICIPITDCQK